MPDFSCAHPQYLWLLLLALPLCWLAWRARRRQNFRNGSLLLWEITLRRYTPKTISRWRQPEIYCTLAATVSGVLALSEPLLTYSSPGPALVLFDQNLRLTARTPDGGEITREAAAALRLATVRRRHDICEVIARDFLPADTNDDDVFFTPSNAVSDVVQLIAARRKAQPKLTVYWISDRMPPPAWGTMQPLIVGSAGDNLALCRAAVMGGKLAAVAGNFSAVTADCELTWAPLTAGRPANKHPHSGQLSVRLLPGEIKAIAVPVSTDCWQAGQGKIALRLHSRSREYNDVLAIDDTLIAEKALAAAIDVQKYPELSRALAAAGLEILPPEKAETADILVIADDAPLPAILPRRSIWRAAAFSAAVNANTAGIGSHGSAPEIQAAGTLAAAAPAISTAGRTLTVYKFSPITAAQSRTPEFPLTVMRLVDALTPASGTNVPAAHDCRPVPPHSWKVDWPAASVNSRPWFLSGIFSVISLFAVGGLAWIAWRRQCERHKPKE